MLLLSWTHADGDEMKQPSCKSGTTRWSYSGVSPSPEVFFKMLNLPSGGKPWKQKKISREDFSDAVGDIDASVSWFDGFSLNMGDDDAEQIC